jgi:hypothetical protein
MLRGRRLAGNASDTLASRQPVPHEQEKEKNSRFNSSRSSNEEDEEEE